MITMRAARPEPNARAQEIRPLLLAGSDTLPRSGGPLEPFAEGAGTGRAKGADRTHYDDADVRGHRTRAHERGQAVLQRAARYVAQEMGRSR